VFEAQGPASAPSGWVEESISGQRVAYSGWLEFLAAVEAHLTGLSRDEDGLKVGGVAASGGEQDLHPPGGRTDPPRDR
jgi:hypothetical protein